MKFQKLTLHNIASIEDATIDFESQPLADSEVFLITGKTGAGKSTILDAICLALYADTPRLDGTKMQGETKDGDKMVKINDPRQLMRRNTGEAFVSLTFIGSNGVHYEAIWSVARARKKATGNMQSKDWQLKILDTDQMLIKDKEIEAEIHAAIGLDFNQFCRTTMLAQGEFTRFLNSKDDEKAEILEKITGVDVYSKIGAKVFEITGQKKQIWDDAQRLIEGTHTLTNEEITDKKEALLALDNQYRDIKTNIDKDVAKRDWLNRESELTKEKNDAENALRIANEAVESEDFKQKERTVKDWHATIDARLWMTEVNKASIEQEKQQKILGRLADTYTELLSGQKYAENEVYKLSLAIGQEDSAANFNLPELREKRDATKDLLNKIATAKERIEILESATSQREEKRKNLTKRKNDLDDKKKQSAAMDAPIHDAKIRMDVRKEALDKQSDTIHNFASTLRTKLQIGDICPICRQEIKSALPQEEELAALVGDLQKAYDEAEKEYKNLNEAKVISDAEIKTDYEAYMRDNKAFNEDKTVITAEQKALDACKECGIGYLNDSTPPSLISLEELTSNAYNELDAKIKIEEKKQSLIGKFETTKANIEYVKYALTTIISAMPAWAKIESDNVKKVENLLTKANTLNTSVATALSVLRSAEDSLKNSQTKLNVFLAEHPEFNTERLEALNAYTSSDIMGYNDSLKHAQETIVAKKTLFENAEKRIVEHQTKKPELAEDDTLDVLTERLQNIEKQLTEIGEKKFSINQELKTDSENHLRLGALIKDADKKNADYQKWSRMNQLVGDATGNKFRKIAQSYVLTSLIYSANSYMKTLSDRYTLKVTPGSFVITLEDAYQGFVSRAASTISGGESFLVSLSLALALSDIGQTLSVDTLFIDEGFGTLSGEPLQNAINTLRSLHTKAGRHVGIISHVEELKERIPVQIQVNQEGNNSNSKVKVIPEVNTLPQ